MFKNFKNNLDVIINFLIAQLFIMAFTLFSIQYGISFLDKILMFICSALAIFYDVKAITSFIQKRGH